LLDCLPQNLLILTRYMDKLQQIRLVANAPVRVRLDGVSFFVGQEGLQKGVQGAVTVDADQIDAFVKKACQSSVYAFENQIANGYLTLEDGARIGLAGQCQTGTAGQTCFAKFTSVCIRVNRHVDRCSSVVPNDLLFSSILVVGLPGFGKTTFLRDLCLRASKKFDVVVLDERGEISQVSNVTTPFMGDVLLHLNRKQAVGLALKSLSPEVIACDEVTASDVSWLRDALCSGVKVYASLHSGSIDAVNKFCSKNELMFENVVFLEHFGGKSAKLYNNLPNYITL